MREDVRKDMRQDLKKEMRRSMKRGTNGKNPSRFWSMTHAA